MTKVSASTLVRRAAKTKNLVEAKRLRARAAKLRREAREVRTRAESLKDKAAVLRQQAGQLRASGNQPGKTKMLSHLVYPMTDDEAANSNNAARAASVDSMPLTQQPGKGEIVGGYLAHLATEIAKIARKKGGIDAIQGKLMTLEHQTRHDAKFDANERVQKAAQLANEQWRTSIVVGFMARCQAMEQLSRSGLPSAVVVDGVTLARVVDALSAAGYSATGKR